MSTKRREPARRRRDENGNTVCSCGCGRAPGKGRRTWHSQECVDRWMWANSPQFVRGKLWDRDKGVCAKCGADAGRAERRAKACFPENWQAKHGHAVRLLSWRKRNGYGKPAPDFLRRDATRFDAWNARVRSAMEKRIEQLRMDGWNVFRRSSWWEVDHIVPVAEGGGQCGPDNYRTLCCRCHLVVTNELRQRLRKAKGPVAPHDNKQSGLPGSGMGLALKQGQPK